MISEKALKAIEYDKIIKDVSDFAVLNQTKDQLLSFVPLTSLSEVENFSTNVSLLYFNTFVSFIIKQ